RLSDAERDGDTIYATFRAETSRLGEGSGSGSGASSATPKASSVAQPQTSAEALESFGPHLAGRSLTPLFGHSHAASGLLHWTAAALAIAAGRLPGGRPWLGDRQAEVTVSALTGAS